jgi:hypothetical protein
MVNSDKVNKMFSVFEHIMSQSSKHQPQPKTSVYDERIKCFQKLIEIQKNLQLADEEYLTVSIAEGTAHENALKRMEAFTTHYKKEYELCEKIMKY